MVIQSDLFIPLVGGHVYSHWKGHVFTIPKRSRLESPGQMVNWGLVGSDLGMTRWFTWKSTLEVLIEEGNTFLCFQKAFAPIEMFGENRHFPSTFPITRSQYHQKQNGDQLLLSFHYFVLSLHDSFISKRTKSIKNAMKNYLAGAHQPQPIATLCWSFRIGKMVILSFMASSKFVLVDLGR